MEFIEHNGVFSCSEVKLSMKLRRPYTKTDLIGVE